MKNFIMEFEKIYLWEDPILSGVVFVSVLVPLLFIEVMAYSGLLVILTVLSFRAYAVYVVKFQKKEEPVNPLAQFSTMNLEVSEDSINENVKNVSKHLPLLNSSLKATQQWFFWISTPVLVQ